MLPLKSCAPSSRDYIEVNTVQEKQTKPHGDTDIISDHWAELLS
jgi:hypothetical protein